jgi:hypothetical protein
MPERMPYYVLAKACILEDAFPSGTDLSSQRLAIMHAVDDETDLLARLINPAARKSAERRASIARQRTRCGLSRLAIFAGGRRFLVACSSLPRP